MHSWIHTVDAVYEDTQKCSFLPTHGHHAGKGEKEDQTYELTSYTLVMKYALQRVH